MWKTKRWNFFNLVTRTYEELNAWWCRKVMICIRPTNTLWNSMFSRNCVYTVCAKGRSSFITFRFPRTEQYKRSRHANFWHGTPLPSVDVVPASFLWWQVWKLHNDYIENISSSSCLGACVYFSIWCSIRWSVVSVTRHVVFTVDITWYVHVCSFVSVFFVPSACSSLFQRT
jgi:hypothetical protein